MARRQARGALSAGRDSRAIDPLWCAVSALVFLAFVPGLESPGLFPREAVLLAGVASIVARDFWVRRGVSIPRAFAALLALPVLSILVGIAISPAPERWFVLGDATLMAAPWVAGWLVASTTREGGAAEAVDRGIAWGAAGGAAVAGVIGIAQYWFGFSAIEQARAPAATFVNRNVAAEALVMAIPLALATAATATDKRLRVAALSAAGLALILLVSTRTRAAWAALLGALALGFALYLARRARERWRIAGALIAGAAALAYVAAVTPPPEAQRLPSVTRSVTLLLEGGDRSAEIRRAMARNTLELIADAPVLGVGAGRFDVVYPLYHERAVETPDFGLERRVEHPHNDFLHAAAELGIPAALAIFVVLVGAAAIAARRAVIAADEGEAAWQAAIAASITGLLLAGLFAFPLSSPTTAFLGCTLAGIAWRPGRSVALSSHAGRIAYAALFAALACAASFVVADLSRQVSLGRALDAFARGDCAGVLADVRPAQDGGFRRGTRGLASMLVFECDRDPERSLRVLEPALAADPHNLNVLLAVGARRLKAGRLDEARTAFEHAAEIHPDLARAWLGIAMVEERSGRLPAARDACERAREAPLGQIPEIDVFCNAL